ncbi:hypothetical protein [Micromonospora olivasterospora]|uniref:hypothetical protein n=1 Tax=Micromonospora olivasterospora TaxID=1880 RepID=UPI0011A9729B|nr:hypothetical protein [Micromonospora olivasterospora]
MLVTDLLRFADRLGTFHDPTLRTPLDHLVSDQAPLGVARDLARPRPVRPEADRRPTPHLPAVQRRVPDRPATCPAAKTGFPPAESAGTDRPAAAGTAPVHRSAPGQPLPALAGPTPTRPADVGPTRWGRPPGVAAPAAGPGRW